MKLEYPKEWFQHSAEIEGEAEVGAGVPPWTREPGDNEIRPIGTRIAFGHFVALWRRNKGWNAEQLANAAGIDAEEILEIEHEPLSEPEPDAVYKLAHVFQVAPKALMEIAGLREAYSPKLREKAIRFAVSSEPISALEPHELEAFEAFVTALTEYKEG